MKSFDRNYPKMASDYRGRTDLPRGIRNNNPGNIADDGTAWQGKVGSDGKFIIFSDMSWGTRAMATAITNMVKGGDGTLDALIRAWSATDQDAYVANVSQATGIAPTATLTLDVPTLSAIMRAMISQEDADSGALVTDQDIADGIGKANSTILSFLQAGVVAAQQDPATTAGIALVVIVGLYLVFRKK